MLMEPEPGNPQEIEGVLNPAVARGPDGHLYLFPRFVAKGNYSRIGIARVKFNAAGDPCGVERLGIALEPEADYERTSHGGGGCEDPRITFIEPLQRYVMTYAALSSIGPRIAFAISEDLFHWKRLGLATFAPYQGIDFVHVDNKDASLFPVAVPSHCGKMQMALLHRPLFAGTRPEETACHQGPREVDLDHESIWISYCPMPPKAKKTEPPGLFNSHYRLAAPVAPWARLKIGAGTPPILTRHGWMIIYHGVSEVEGANSDAHHFCYSAGVMILSKDNPREVLYRSAEPILTPTLPQERIGTIGNVVFPTGIDRRSDIGQPDRYDVYYGMADNRIGVARLDFAPLHNPVNLEGIHAVRKILGSKIPQIAVFDTSFHRTLSQAAQTYPGPYDWLEKEIRRYGFHGTSFSWASGQAARLLQRENDPALRLIICHLGGGCSLAATIGGKSVDTTMGFTPMDGIAMCTRSGALDPGILLFLLRENPDIDALEKTLDRKSGLQGLSGLPGDTRILLPEVAKGNQRAKLAVDVFIHRLQAGIGQMIASLSGRPDAIVFTDAIGEDEPLVRSRACEPFQFMGVEVDLQKNAASPLDSDISLPKTPVRVLIVKSREDWQIARECHEIYPWAAR